MYSLRMRKVSQYVHLLIPDDILNEKPLEKNSGYFLQQFLNNF